MYKNNHITTTPEASKQNLQKKNLGLSETLASIANFHIR